MVRRQTQTSPSIFTVAPRGQREARLVAQVARRLPARRSWRGVGPVSAYLRFPCVFAPLTFWRQPD